MYLFLVLAPPGEHDIVTNGFVCDCSTDRTGFPMVLLVWGLVKDLGDAMKWYRRWTAERSVVFALAKQYKWNKYDWKGIKSLKLRIPKLNVKELFSHLPKLPSQSKDEHKMYGKHQIS